MHRSPVLRILLVSVAALAWGGAGTAWGTTVDYSLDGTTVIVTGGDNTLTGGNQGATFSAGGGDDNSVRPIPDAPDFVAGATGTGETKTLQGMAEQLSAHHDRRRGQRRPAAERTPPMSRSPLDAPPRVRPAGEARRRARRRC